MNVLKLSEGGFVGFKPRAAVLGHAASGLNLSGTVLTCEYMGYEDLLTVDLGFGNIVIRSRQRVASGTKLEINIPAEDLYYFDEDQNRTHEILNGEVVSVFHVED